MTHILLYWNHICVLHRQEKAFLQELAGRLHREDIELEVRFFGLGYPEHMSEYLARPDAVLPDLIVSADLEVFEDRAIFSKMEPELYPAADWVSLRESPALDAVRRGDKLLPAAAIPLVYYPRELGIPIPGGWGCASRCGCRTGTGWPSAGSTTLPSRR